MQVTGSDVAPGSGPSGWSTFAWLASTLLLVALVVGIWLRMEDDRASTQLASAIVSGDRPRAPALPDRPLDQSPAQGLPRWYRAAAGDLRPARDAEVLVVNVWTSWCGPCREEAPVLKRVADEYDGRAHIVGLNAGAQDLQSDAKAFVHEFGLDFTVLRASRADQERWGVRQFPKTYVVGVDGRVSSYVDGPIDEETLRGLLDAELAEHRGA